MVTVMRAWAATIVVGLSAALTPAGAVGQAARPAPTAAGPAMPGLNSNAPVDATAESMEVFRDQRLTLMKGNVEVIQGDVRIRTPELRLFSSERAAAAGGSASGIGPGTSFGDIERMEAAGPVYYVTSTQQAKGDHATYLKATDVLTMTGNVVVTQDKNVITGDKLVIDQKTGHTTFISNAQAPKRVRAVFYPNQAQQPATPAGPAAAAPAPKKKR